MLGIHWSEEGRGRGNDLFAGWLLGWMATWYSRVTAIAMTILAFVQACHLVAPFLHHGIDIPRISRQTSRRQVDCGCEGIGIKVEWVGAELTLASD
jgi:hypothetical protein